MYKTTQRPQRNNQPLIPSYSPKTKQLKESLFFNYTRIYNQLPLSFKILSKNKFKTQIKTHIRLNQPFHKIPKDMTDNDNG